MRETGRTTKANENVGESKQDKNQVLALSGVTEVYGKLIFENGSNLKFLDGNEKDGYVLTSDDDGNISLKSGTSVPASPRNSIQFNKNDKYGGSPEFTFDPKLRAFSLGKRTGGDIGISSFTHGLLNKASGTASHAQGKTTTAFGVYSHSEGSFTSSIGDCSHAEGFKTTAKGEISHAEGYSTETGGKGSHAEGSGTFSFGKFSHSEGQKTKSQGEYSHAEGSHTQSLGRASHAQGISSCAIAEGSHSQGGFTKAGGVLSFSSGSGIFGKEILANGNISFNHSTNNEKQDVGHGALADNSAILGGVNNHIDIDNTGATIMGGNSIKLVNNYYVDTTAVGNLAIFKEPLNGGDNAILTWDSEKKLVTKISQATPADFRIKKNVEKEENVLSKLLTLNAYSFENNEKSLPISTQGLKSYGLLAHEVEKEFPLVVKEDIVYNNKNYKGIKYNEFVPILLQGINELTNKVEKLSNKLLELDLKVNA